MFRELRLLLHSIRKTRGTRKERRNQGRKKTKKEKKELRRSVRSRDGVREQRRQDNRSCLLQAIGQSQFEGSFRQAVGEFLCASELTTSLSQNTTRPSKLLSVAATMLTILPSRARCVHVASGCSTSPSLTGRWVQELQKVHVILFR